METVAKNYRIKIMQENELIGPNFEKIYTLYKQLGLRIIQTFQAKTKRDLRFSGKQSVPYDPARLFSHGKTFNMIYLYSKRPYFISYRGLL